MAQDNIKRKDFFKSLIGKNQQSRVLEGTGEPDPLFDKYARKSLGNRRYSNEVRIPAAPAEVTDRIGNITSGLAPYAGAWTVWEASYLLRRIGYGVKKAELDAALSSGMSATVNNLLIVAPVSLPSAAPLNFYQAQYVDSSGVALGDTWTTANLTYVGADDGTLNSLRQQSLISWSWAVLLNEPTTIREKMMHFWYHFIPVNFSDVRDQRNNSATTCNDYMNLLRTNCLGNFKTLIKSIAKTPAMLVYLGNQFSTAATPNENFARELLELFTMGKVPVQNYTEADVQAAAKVLSGWRVANYNAAYPLTAAFNASFHNQTNKVFSANFGSTTIANQAGANGANEFELFFDMLFSHQQQTIAKYLSRRLYRYFVYYDIDANIEANVIGPLATLIINSNWEMAPVLSALLKSEHFYDIANRGVMIKSPVDYMAGLLRTFNVNTTAAAGATQVYNQYIIWNYLQSYSNNNLEQGLGLVPTVSGWKAYYQDPTYYQNWINSNSIQRRASFVTSLISGFSQGGTSIKIDPIAFVQQFPSNIVQDPDLLINEMVPYLFTVDLPAAYKLETKIATLLNGQITNSYWTTAWNNYLASPTTANTNLVRTRLNSLLTTFLQLAEFQLM
ncbi:MAG: DUF1800 family protein [Sphingobacteriales bacterium]|nr:MAG: DUF1800 family protein [Sphingobacteriales bacterium]